MQELYDLIPDYLINSGGTKKPSTRPVLDHHGFRLA
jgi:hypothetical protein